MNRILIAGAVIVGIFYAGVFYQSQRMKVLVAEEATKQAKLLVIAEKKKWKREIITKTKIKLVKEYINANPTDCAAQPYNPELVRNVLRSGTD